MDVARFVFQALFPDPDPDAVRGREGCCVVVFDIEHGDKLYSHQTAQVMPEDGALEIVHNLPMPCPDFPQAVQTYFELMMGDHGKTLSPSGPKGMRPGRNVFRAEWAVKLKVGTKH